LTGRVLDEHQRPTRVRYYFEGSDRTSPGLPEWCRIVRRCKKCEHFSCPFCVTWCDTIGHVDCSLECVKANGEEHLSSCPAFDSFDMCCDGECTYDEPEPHEAEDLDEFADDFRKALD
jgi:hypothetical protein